MQKDRLTLVWGLCLILIGCGTLILFGAKMFGIVLPAGLVRGLGMMDFVAIPTLTIATLKMNARRNQKK